jgi:hypothetical protein
MAIAVRSLLVNRLKSKAKSCVVLNPPMYGNDAMAPANR